MKIRKKIIPAKINTNKISGAKFAKTRQTKMLKIINIFHIENKGYQ